MQQEAPWANTGGRQTAVASSARSSKRTTVGMVPRGEVGLIFAGAGLAAGVIAGDLSSALVVVVMLTTLAEGPFWLKALYRARK